MTVVRVFVHNSSKSYAIVTGSNKGIGFKVCRQLASNGVTVAVTARDEKRALKLWKEHKECGLSDYVVFHQIDVASSFSIASLAHCVKTIWRLDILVNNAGISGMALGASTGRVNNAGISGESLDWHAIEASLRNAIKTINDVLFGVISSGLSRYLEIHSPEALRKGLQVTGVAMVNLRKQPGIQDLAHMMEKGSRSSWGNKLGAFLLPIHCFHHQNCASPLLYVERAKAIMDRKKQSFEAPFTFKFGDLLLSCFGPKAPSWICHRVLCHTTFNFTSVIGPQQEITMAGNPLTYIRVNDSSLPNALTMQMVSYAGKAEMQILAAKDIIPDPKVLAKFFEDSLLDMKEAAAKEQ